MLRLLLALPFVGALAAPGALAQTTYFVPGDAATIQGGLDLAADGDTVVVGPGTYGFQELPLDFDGKALTLRSSHGPEQTILDGGGSVRHVFLWDGEGLDTVLQGFTLLNGKAPDSTTDAYNELDGGSIVMIDNASLTIRDCIFRGNRAGRGDQGTGGSDGTDGDTGDDGTDGEGGFVGGRGGHGGAIHVETGGAVIDRCVFFDNVAGQGGRGGPGGDGGDGGPSGFLQFAGDGGDGAKGGPGGDGGFGGAISNQNGQVVVSNSLFIANRSGRGGTGGIGGAGGAGGESGLITSDGDPGSVGGGGRGGDGGGGGTFWVGEVGPLPPRLTLVNCSVTRSDLGDPGASGTNGNGFSSGGIGAFGEGVVAWEIDGEITARNSIFWDNEPFKPLFDGPYSFGNQADVRYSNVQVFYSGVGNISSDPLWDDAADPIWSGYQLSPGSPCVDAGSSDAYLAETAGYPSLFELTGHIRTIDVPSLPDAAVSAAPAVDMGAYEVIAPATVESFNGCGVNLPDSLTHVSGAAQLGGSVTIALDNAVGSQAPGSLAYFSLSIARSAEAGCGPVVPGFGLFGNGAPGEFLLSYAPGAFVTTAFAGVWSGPGQPVEAPFGIATSPSLLGLPFYVQGALVDTSPTATVPIGLTNGLRYVHGE